MKKDTLDKLKKYYIKPRLMGVNKVLIGFFIAHINTKQEGNYLVDFNFKKLKISFFYLLPLFFLYFLYYVYNITDVISILPIPYIALCIHVFRGGYLIVTIKLINEIEEKYVLLKKPVGSNPSKSI